MTWLICEQLDVAQNKILGSTQDFRKCIGSENLVLKYFLVTLKVLDNNTQFCPIKDQNPTDLHKERIIYIWERKCRNQKWESTKVRTDGNWATSWENLF